MFKNFRFVDLYLKFIKNVYKIIFFFKFAFIALVSHFKTTRVTKNTNFYQLCQKANKNSLIIRAFTKYSVI